MDVPKTQNKQYRNPASNSAPTKPGALQAGIKNRWAMQPMENFPWPIAFAMAAVDDKDGWTRLHGATAREKDGSLAPWWPIGWSVILYDPGPLGDYTGPDTETDTEFRLLVPLWVYRRLGWIMPGTWSKLPSHAPNTQPSIETAQRTVRRYFHPSDPLL